MARLLVDLGAHGRGPRHDDAARALRDDRQRRARRGARRPDPRLGAAPRSAAGAARTRAPRAARAAIFRRGDRFRRISRRSRPWARGSCQDRATSSRCPTGSSPRRSICTKRRSPAPRRRCWPRPRRPGMSEIRHAACEPHVVELCEFLRKLGAGITGEGTSTIRVEGAAKLGGAQHQLWGDYIEAGSWAVVAAVTGGEIDVRGARAVDLEGRGRGPAPDEHRARDGRRRVSRAPVEAACGRPHHDRPLAGFPERSGQPADRAGDAVRGPDAGARLALRTASVCARAVERHGRRPVSLRSAPHHRDGTRSGCAAGRSTAATCAREWR